MSWFNPENWYWSVQNSSPGTQVWQSSSGTFVALANADYVAFLAAGNTATVIDTFVSLQTVIQNYNLSLISSSQTFYIINTSTITVNTTLGNPVSEINTITVNAGGDLNLLLPKMNLFGSIPIGVPFYVINDSGSNHNLQVFMNDGVSKPTPASAITLLAPGSYLLLVNTANATNNGAVTVLVIGSALGRPLATALGGLQTTNIPALGQVPVGDGAGAYIPTDAFTANGSWTPSDQSGAGLTFSSVTVAYSRVGNMVFVYGRFTFPVTADGSNTLIGGLPVSVPNSVKAQNLNIAFTNAGLAAPLAALTIANSTTFQLVNMISGARVTNANLTGAAVSFNIMYPAV